MGADVGLHADLTYRIIGCVKRVHRVLGSGFLEQVYQNALVLELQEAGLEVIAQAPIEVRYRNQVVGIYRADLLVNGLVIIELKAVEHLLEAHEVQLVNYLRATTIEVGLLVNFYDKLIIRRRILTNDRKLSS
ncbi:MAG: GxxExxY protein [Armatimonadetes bacterium]|jgi:GxxExxY protein|nr:GxxExxY protein [Armatimonadota bacterium]